MKRSKKRKIRRALSGTMACLMTAAILPEGFVLASQTDTSQTTYQITAMEEDGFIRVENPNGGERLSYSPNSGMQLLEVQDGEYTYAFKDLNKNGTLDVYEDWREDDETRARDLASRLSIEQMAALMLYPFMGTPQGGELNEATMQMLETKGCRFVLSNSYDSISDNVKWNNNMQEWTETNDPFGIPVNRSADPLNTTSNEMAVGQHTEGSVVKYSENGVSGWPGNLGLAATFDPSYALLHGQIASQEYRALGITTALSPQIDLATEPRWSRFSGTFGENSQLDADMGVNYIKGFQSTWDGLGEEATDLGWAEDSVVCMAKHFPGDGAAEGGREAHNNYGKYNIYPGNNLEEHIGVFDAIINIEDSLTGGVKALMPSYSIAMNEYTSIGEAVGSGYSSYKLQTILREKLGFEGLICCDWEITTGKIWGVEDLTEAERHLLAIKSGLNMFGGSANTEANIDAYHMGVLSLKNYDGWSPATGIVWNEEEDTAEETMHQLYEDSAYQCLLISFYSGLFEDPYLSVAESEEICGNSEFKEAGYQAQLDSVVMLKNKGNIIKESDGEKKTVYIPLTYTPASSGWGGDIPASIGYSFGTEEGLDLFFNVVTDTIREGADPESYTAEDIVRRTDFTDVDFALISFSAPYFGGYQADKVDLDNSDGTIDNGYYPISLQFHDYYADPQYVQETIGLDQAEELEWIAAGGEVRTSRSYSGKTTAGDTSTLEMIQEIRNNIGDLPLVAYVEATNPFCAYEFEKDVDALLVGFSISQTAACEVIAGEHEPYGLLPMQLPKDMNTVETQYSDVAGDMEAYVDSEGNTYDFAFGLNWSGVISDERTQQYQ